MNDHQPSYPLPTETIPSLDLSHHLDDLIEIRQFFESRGIETKNTRIERYGQYLEKISHMDTDVVDAELRDGSKIFKNSVGSPLLSPSDWFLYVLREVHELMWILHGLKARLPDGIDDKLRMIVGGRDFAALDIDSLSRDTQFELRIASYFCQAGADVDLSTKTDIIATTDKEIFYLECKRVASKGQLGKRLSEARKQLGLRMPRKDGKRLVLGCIAVDVTKVAFSHNGLTCGITNEHSGDVVKQKLIDIGDSAASHFSFDSCRKLLAYWLQIHISSFIMKPEPTPATRFSSYHIPRLRMTRKEVKAIGAFYWIFESFSKEDPRTNASRRLTRRTTFEFPAGSTFRIDSDRVLKLLAKGQFAGNEEAEVVGTLTMNGMNYNFTFFEIGMLSPKSITEWQNTVTNDPGQADFKLITRMYLNRYPYEVSELPSS